MQNTKEGYEVAATGLKRQLRDWLPRDSRTRCLDLACGCGEFLYLLEKIGIVQLEGVDLCSEQIDIAKQHTHLAKLHYRDILEFLKSKESNSIDYVTALNVVEHLDENVMYVVFREIHRVLSPGGRFIAMVPNACSPFGSLTRYWDLSHQRAFTPNSLVQLATLTGFTRAPFFREWSPRPHGIISLFRYLAWQGCRLFFSLLCLVLFADRKGGIYSPDLLVQFKK